MLQNCACHEQEWTWLRITNNNFKMTKWWFLRSLIKALNDSKSLKKDKMRWIILKCYFVWCNENGRLLLYPSKVTFQNLTQSSHPMVWATLRSTSLRPWLFANPECRSCPGLFFKPPKSRSMPKQKLVPLASWFQQNKADRWRKR